MSAMRPAFGAAWNRFREVNVNVEQVGKLLGGKVQMESQKLLELQMKQVKMEGNYSK